MKPGQGEQVRLLVTKILDDKREKDLSSYGRKFNSGLIKAALALFLVGYLLMETHKGTETGLNSRTQPTTKPITTTKEEAFTNQALEKGYSQDEIDEFLATKKGDELKGLQAYYALLEIDRLLDYDLLEGFFEEK